MTKHKSIAVDGPSGAGKSTLAKLLARRLGFLYVDTGAIYRTVGLRAYRAGVDPEDEAAVTALLDGLDIELKYGADGLQHMYLDGEDVTDAIRQHVISRYTSGVSAIPAVRARSSGEAVRKIFTSAPGRTTVPMSRPSMITSCSRAMSR